MTTNFNQSMYAQMRAKKNEPLSNLRAKTVQVMDKGAFVTLATPVTPGTETTRTASPATLVEEIIPLQNKRQHTGDKLKDKANSRSSSVWDDAGVTLVQAQKTFTTEEMKVFSSTSPIEVVGRHLHKLVQVLVQIHHLLFFFFLFSFFLFFFLRSSSFFQVLGESLHITLEYLTQEAKVVPTVYRVEALEAKNSKLEKDLIAAMDKANTLKEKIKVMGDDLRAERLLTMEKDEQLQASKEKLKTIAAKAVKAF